jgi:hypothetical protein
MYSRRAREWTDLQIEKLYAFIGTIINIEVYKEPRTDMYVKVQQIP